MAAERSKRDLVATQARHGWVPACSGNTLGWGQQAFLRCLWECPGGTGAEGRWGCGGPSMQAALTALWPGPWALLPSWGSLSSKSLLTQAQPHVKAAS